MILTPSYLDLDSNENLSVLFYTRPFYDHFDHLMIIWSSGVILSILSQYVSHVPGQIKSGYEALVISGTNMD